MQKMFSKYKISFIIFLCMIALLSVGFSSWTLNGGSTQETDSIIEVDHVINSQEYVYLDTSFGDNGISCFEFSDTGFIDTEFQSVSSNAKIETKYKLNLGKCKEIFDINQPILINITIRYNKINESFANIFANDNDGTKNLRTFGYTLTTPATGAIITPGTVSISDENYSYTIPLTLTNIVSNDEVTFTITYNLYSTVGDYFKTNYYSLLFTNDVDFVVVATISGTNKES